MDKLTLSTFVALLLVTLANPSQATEMTYPRIADTPPEYRFDQNLNESNSIDLYDIKDRELNLIMTAARLESEKARAEGRDLNKNTLITKMVHERNLARIRRMNSVSRPEPREPGMVTALTADQIKETAASIEFSPAVDNRARLNKKYNPKGDIGYCFLRAHYYAGAVHQRGLDMTSVRKVFLVGTMKLFGANWAPISGWRYHVATTVRGTDGKWYVLDNHLGIYLGKQGYAKNVYTVEQWYSYYERFMNTTENMTTAGGTGISPETARAKALFLYFAEPDRVIPEHLAYAKETFYGVDRNNDGQLDRSEETFYGAFKDVDQFLQVPIHKCSNERYAPLSASDDQCKNMTLNDRQQMHDRQLLLNKWRLDVSYEQEQDMNQSN